MTFARLTRGDWVALVAALGLLLVLPMTWYTTKVGDALRQESTQFAPQINNALTPTPAQQASQAAATQEKNAYRASAPLDRVLLVALLAASALAIVAAFLRAAGRRFEGPLTPSALAVAAGTVGCLLVAFRILDPPGLHSAAVVKVWAPVALLCAAALTLGARMAALREREAPTDDVPAPAGQAPDPVA